LALGFIATQITYHSVNAIIYYCEKRNEQKITYKQYVRISSIAPEKWAIICDGYYLTYNNHVIYMASYFDMLRLKRDYRKEQNEINDIKYVENRAKLIKEWQKDINNFHDDYLEQIGVYLKEGKKL
jgi:hypothetical protein